MEKRFCLGEDCPDKRCDLCYANHTTQLPVTDSFRTHKSVSTNGYYASGGLVHVRDEKTGKITIQYARPHGD